MENLRPFLEAVTGMSNIFTIIASGIAIYVFLTKRRELSRALQILLNYSFQTTLNELREKLERLNEYNANEPADVLEIRNILHEIAGQIRGNEKLLSASSELLGRIEGLAQSKKLSEPSKRSMVSELREVIRNIQVNTFESITRKHHE